LCTQESKKLKNGKSILLRVEPGLLHVVLDLHVIPHEAEDPDLYAGLASFVKRYALFPSQLFGSSMGSPQLDGRGRYKSNIRNSFKTYKNFPCNILINCAGCCMIGKCVLPRDKRASPADLSYQGYCRRKTSDLVSNPVSR